MRLQKERRKSKALWIFLPPSYFFVTVYPAGCL